MEMATEFAYANTLSQSPISTVNPSSSSSSSSTSSSASLVFALEATRRERDVKADDAQRLSSLAAAQARELEALRERVIASDALARMLKGKSEALESENSILREATTTQSSFSTLPASSPYSGFTFNSPNINNQSNIVGLKTAGGFTDSRGFDGGGIGGGGERVLYSNHSQSSPHSVVVGMAPNAFQLYNEVSAMHVEISSLRSALDQSRADARISERNLEKERSQDAAPLALIRDLRNALTNQSEQLEEARLAIKSMREETQAATRAANQAAEEARKAADAHAIEIAALHANHARELDRRLVAVNEARLHDSVADAQALQRLSVLEREVPALRRALQTAEDRCFLLQRRLAVSEDELAVYKRCDVYSATLRKSIADSKIHLRETHEKF
jgi:chromosome segregation ATPase